MNDQLFMGSCCVNITPAVPVTTDGMGPGKVAKSVESDLEIRGFTFAKGEKAFTLLTCDLLHIDRQDFKSIEQKIRPEALKHWKEWDCFPRCAYENRGKSVGIFDGKRIISIRNRQCARAKGKEY